MRVISKHKKAYFEYEIEETLEAGLVLKGHEVKSVKFGHVNISDAIIKVSPSGVTILNMDIPLYKKTSPTTVPGYQPKGERMLLVTKKQQTQLWSKTQKTGLKIIPLEVIELKNGRIKLKIAVARLRKKVEKRSVIKERDIKREMDKQIRHL